MYKIITLLYVHRTKFLPTIKKACKSQDANDGTITTTPTKGNYHKILLNN